MSPSDRATEEANTCAEAAELLARQAFPAARAGYERLLAREESAEALEGLAAACRPLDDIPGAVRALKRAYRLRVDAGQAAEAADVACSLADLELTELGISNEPVRSASRPSDQYRLRVPRFRVLLDQ